MVELARQLRRRGLTRSEVGPDFRRWRSCVPGARRGLTPKARAVLETWGPRRSNYLTVKRQHEKHLRKLYDYDK